MRAFRRLRALAKAHVGARARGAHLQVLAGDDTTYLLLHTVGSVASHRSFAVETSSNPHHKPTPALADYATLEWVDRFSITDGCTATAPSAVCAWAASNGVQVSARNRVSAAMIEQYPAAGN
jgi:hypothetical protein